jgi:hypothetical protein
VRFLKSFKGLETGDGAAFFEHVDFLYCRVVYFDDGSIVKVRADLDSAMVATFEENPIQSGTGRTS